MLNQIALHFSDYCLDLFIAYPLTCFDTKNEAYFIVLTSYLNIIINLVSVLKYLIN